MGEPSNQYEGIPPSSDTSKLPDSAQVIKDSFQRLILTSRVQAQQKCKVANQKAVEAVRGVLEQYHERMGLVDSRNKKEIERIARKYHSLELVDEATAQELEELVEYAEERFIAYGQSKLFEQERFKYNDELDVDLSLSLEAQMAVVEQINRTLETMQLPRLFLGHRPLWIILGYCLVVFVGLMVIYTYQWLPLFTLYFSLPGALVLGLFVFGAGGGYLWRQNKTELQEIYTQFRDAQDSAQVLLRQKKQATQQGLDGELQQVQQRTEAELAQLEQTKATAYERIGTNRDITYRKIGRELLAIEQALKAKQKEALHQAGFKTEG